MTDQYDSVPAGDPHRYPDGRPKSSPDDTSLLGLAAVWSELDAPMPPKRPAGRRRAQHGRAGRRIHRRRAQPVGKPVLIGLVSASALALGVIAVLTLGLT